MRAHPVLGLLVGIGAMCVGGFMFVSQRGGAPWDMDRNDISRAALRIIGPLPMCHESWLRGTVEQCDRAQEDVDRRRVEFKEFEPAWMRKEILYWLDYAEGQIKKARKDCVTQASFKDMEIRRKQSEAEQDRVNDILKSIGGRT